MREIDQIVGLRSKLGFHLLGNPHRPLPHPMDFGLAARSRLQGADRQSLSRFLRASRCGAKNGSHRTRLMRQRQAGFLPAHLASLSAILRGFSGSRLRAWGHILCVETDCMQLRASQPVFYPVCPRLCTELDPRFTRRCFPSVQWGLPYFFSSFSFRCLAHASAVVWSPCKVFFLFTA